MEIIISVAAILISFVSAVFSIYQHYKFTKSNLRYDLEIVSGIDYKDRSFYPYQKRFLFIRNLSQRDTAIININEFRPGEAYRELLPEPILDIGGWKIIKIELKESDKKPEPIALLVEDIDSKSYLGIGYINPYNEEDILTQYQKRFKTIDHFEKYFTNLRTKLEAKHLNSLKEGKSPNKKVEQ